MTGITLDDTPVWRIYKQSGGLIEPVLHAWYTDHQEDKFLTAKTFGSKRAADEWLTEFWQTYWKLL